MKKIGFTIGKFAPFHKGHEYLINKALNEMDEFYVVVYDTPQLNIDIETKIKWISKQFSTIKILKAYNSPKQYGLDKKSVKIQMDYLSNIIKNIPVTHFYSSEEYGKYVAEFLEIENVWVDKERKIYKISATDIRTDINKNKKYLNEIVYKDIVCNKINRIKANVKQY